MEQLNFTDLIKGLTQPQKLHLQSLLQKDLEKPDLADLSVIHHKNHQVFCPHCNSIELYGHGSYRGRNRYKCKKCKKTFNDLTGTAISCIKKKDKFEEYIELVINTVSIRKAAKQLKLSTKTVFDWRHKILSGLSKLNGSDFVGIVECDDKQVNISEKGSRKLTRSSYKRPSDRKTKRGVSNDKVSVVIATDRNNNPMAKVAKKGRLDSESLERTIGEYVNKRNVLCSDSHPSIILWAKEKEVEHHTFLANKNHVKSKCYHVQHVNSIASRYENWIKRFYGIATKYLNQYLNWHIFLIKTKHSNSQVDEISRNIVKNVLTTKIYRQIHQDYHELINSTIS